MPNRILGTLALVVFVVCAGAGLAQERYYYSQQAAWQNSDRHDTQEEYAVSPRPRPENIIEPREEYPDDTYASPRNTAPKPSQQARPIASALEALYAGRIVDPLEQFGYDLFGVPGSDTQQILAQAAGQAYALPSGAVQDDFILNIGDEVEIVFSGQRTDRGLHQINSQGLLLLKDFPPIPAAGRSMGQVRISLEAAAKNLHNTQAYIALSSVRQIGVLVVGHVKKPGRKNLTVFHTILDALMESGGIDKTGSLRQVKLIRDGRTTIIDIYDLLMYGAANIDMQLHDGDRIIIPPIGPSIAIAGEVKRPGIYEIRPRMNGMRFNPQAASEKLSLNDMLELAGGVLSPGDTRFIKLDIGENSRENTQDIKDAFAPEFGDGAILIVAKGKEKRADTVELGGHTRKPGIYALDDVPTLGKLLPDEATLGEDIYPLIGVIERWNKEQLAHVLIAFPLRLVITGDFDRKLEDGDVIHLFSREQIENLDETANASHENEDDQARPSRKKKSGLIMASYGNDQYEQGSAYGQASGEEYPELDDPIMISFLRERAAFVRGAVRKPGPYPVADGVTLDSVLAASGGLALEADTSNIEVTSAHAGEGIKEGKPTGTRRQRINLKDTNPEDILVTAGDSIRVNQKFEKITDKSVMISGEVVNPGRYDLVAGDKVSDLLARAGGLTQQAYPEGSIFSRLSERKAEESRFRAAARDLERSLAVAIERDDDKAPDTQQISLARGLASELREVEAVGRITVETDPGILAAQPDLDMLLETGDHIFVPKRPLTVRVSGEILSPASLQFRENKKPLEYIQQAGGFTFHADTDRTFVLYPDGSAQPLQVSSWNSKPIFIPPGSTIVVPRDPKPFDFIESAKDISQILSNLAITAIFLDDVRDDDNE